MLINSILCICLNLCPNTIAEAKDTTLRINESIVVAKETTFGKVEDKVNKHQIIKGLGNSFGDLLSKNKGVSLIKSGSTISKPVIHGMHSNRILIINNGVVQQGQQWGEDHAPELDFNNAGSISIIKGAEAVKYGTDALGGVIILNPAPLPFYKKIEGKFYSMYGSDGKRYAFSGDIGGSIGKAQNFAWRIQGTYLNGGDRSTARYLLNNTGMQEKDFSVTFGYQGEKLRFTTYYSYYNTKNGVMYTANMGNVDLLKLKIEYGKPLEFFPFTRNINYPYQKVEHHLGKFEIGYNLFHNSSITYKAGIQYDNRNEYHQRRNYRSKYPSLALRLFNFQENLDWKYSNHRYLCQIGVNHSFIQNTNEPGTGVVPLIPNYVQTNYSIYNIHKYHTNRLQIEAGLRYDYQYTNAKGINAYSESYGGIRTYHNVSYTLSTQYNILNNLSVKANIGMAWRAPNVYELYSLGQDHGAGTYNVGDSTFRSERGTKLILSLNYSNKIIDCSIDAFAQRVNGFIYDQPTKEVITLISGAYPIFKYKQTNAFFRGIDASISIKPLKWINYENTCSYVMANIIKTNQFLPYIPPFRMQNSITFNLPNYKSLINNYIKINNLYVAKQKRFDPSTDLIPYTPPSYMLWGAEIGSEFKIRYGTIRVNIMVSNALNKLYKDYTNRFRYFAHDSGRDIRILLSYNF